MTKIHIEIEEAENVFNKAVCIIFEMWQTISNLNKAISLKHFTL